MSPRRVSKAEQQRQAYADAQRAARKAAKRGNARLRRQYNDNLVDGVEWSALAAALEARAESLDAPKGRQNRSARAAPSLAGTRRWVPIGPSVVRKGQAADSPRVAGRIRDLAVDGEGRRAYAASAMGGVWYTDDGGATWAPFGGWSERRPGQGGAVNTQAMGALLVAFGDDETKDVVLAGTGETDASQTRYGSRNTGGLGVLTAVRPASAADPWEKDTGVATLEGLGIYRLVRKPGCTPGSTGTAAGETADVVLACTNLGAFVGTRKTVAGVDVYDWAPLAGIPAGLAGSAVTDAVWVTANRLVLALQDNPPLWCDGAGGAATALTDTGGNPVLISGVTSLGRSPVAPNRLYLLGELTGPPLNPMVWQIADATVATPQLAPVTGAPASAALWDGQRDYDQAIAVDTVNGVDRIYLGGSTIKRPLQGDYIAALYCYDVKTAPSLALVPAVGVSRPGWGGGLGQGDGASQPGLVGENVHADVHVIALTGRWTDAVTNQPKPRQVWVGCDGGIFVSDQAGRPFSFAAANTGLAALQPVFVRSHPLHGHMVTAGFQDNGTQIRTGDTVWEELFQADGGGVAWIPRAPHGLVRQYIRATWNCTLSDYINPVARGVPTLPANLPAGILNEATAALFYSGVAVVSDTVRAPAVSRLAIGTTRVWITDDLAKTPGTKNTWAVLPWPGTSAAQDARPAAGPNLDRFGVPNPSLGSVVTLAWASTTELLVVYNGGVVRYVDVGGTWQVKVWRLTSRHVAVSRSTTLTDIAVGPKASNGMHNFYLATLGVGGSAEETLWYFTADDDVFHRTTLRHQLDTGPPPGTLGPRDPVYSVVVDPRDPTKVYAGTATGVWCGTRTTATAPHTWVRLEDGLPSAMVQDLSIWVDPNAAADAGAATPRLLRAAVQARGVWELDLAANARRETWIRAHRFDNRRSSRANDVDPMTTPEAAAPLTDSPDITVRPAWPVTTPPRFPGTSMIRGSGSRPFDIWTFQTAFRWLYPNIEASGVFTEALDNAVSYHRANKMTPKHSALGIIDRDVWEDVVGKAGDATKGVHVSDPGVVSHGAGVTSTDPLAVYRSPWQTPRAPHRVLAEVDALESVVPVSTEAGGSVWTVYRGLNVVDVVAHHRDTRELASGEGYVVVMWRAARTVQTLLDLPSPDVLTYLKEVASGAGTVHEPPNWNILKTTISQDPKRTINVPFSAAMPRGRSVDVNLGSVPPGQYAIVLAFVHSTRDDGLLEPSPLDPPGPALPPKPLQTIAELITTWPHIAARVVKVVNPPASP